MANIDQVQVLVPEVREAGQDQQTPEVLQGLGVQRKFVPLVFGDDWDDDVGIYCDDIFPNAATPQPLYDALHRDLFGELCNGTDINGEEQNKFWFGGL